MREEWLSCVCPCPLHMPEQTRAMDWCKLEAPLIFETLAEHKLICDNRARFRSYPQEVNESRHAIKLSRVKNFDFLALCILTSIVVGYFCVLGN